MANMMSAPLEIPEFRDVHRRDDGMWTAWHFGSGDVIEAATWDRLVTIQAPLARVAHWYRVKGISA